MSILTPTSVLQTRRAEVLAEVTAPMGLMVVGPDRVTRSAQTLGAYSGGSLAVTWPSKTLGEVIDTTRTSVVVSDAAALYYTHLGTSPDAGLNVPQNGNQFRNASIAWKTANGTTRTSGIPADVAVGDWVRLQIVGGGSPQISQVTGFVAETTAAIVGAATAAAANIGTAAGVTSCTRTSGTSTAVSTANASNPTLFNGFNYRLNSETYTIKVVNVGADGAGITGAWTSVQLQVTSASGLDTPASYVTPAPSVAANIGSLGCQVTWAHGASGNDWVVGDVYTLTVTRTYTLPTAASGGTYSGTRNTTNTYIVQCTRGGSIATSLPGGYVRAQVSVYSAGSPADASGPHDVTTGSAISIGTLGTTITLTQASGFMYAGDTWTIAVTAAADGAIRTIVLADKLSTTLAAQASLKVELAEKGAVTLTRQRYGTPGSYNWTQTQDLITVNAGATVYSTRSVAYLPVIAGTAAVTYSAFRSSNLGVVHTVYTAADCDALLPADAVGNDLSFAVRRALSPDGTVGVNFIATPDATLASFQAAFNVIADRADYARVLPLSEAADVLAAAVSFTTSRNTSSAGLRTGLTIAPAITYTKDIILTQAGGADAVATISDDPNQSGTQYVLVNDASGTFVTSGVRAGDLYRTAFASDGFDGTTYSSYAVSSVINNQQLILVSGPGVPVGSPIKYTISRVLTAAERVAAFGEAAKAYHNGQISVVFAGIPKWAGTVAPAFCFAAEPAGIRCYSAPQQGIANVGLSSSWDLSDVRTSYNIYLDTLAAYGVFVCSNTYEAEPYIRNQNTTHTAWSDSTSATSEESSVSTRDAIRFFIRNRLAPFYGTTNLTDENIQIIAATINTAFGTLPAATTGTAASQLGQLVLDGRLISVRPHAVLKNRLIVIIEAQTPVPFAGTDIFIIDIVV